MPGSGVKNHITVYISDEDAKILKRVKKRLGNKFSISGEARKAIVRAAERALAKETTKKKTLKRGSLRR